MATRYYLTRRATNRIVRGVIQGVWDVNVRSEPQGAVSDAWIYTREEFAANLLSTSKTHGGIISSATGTGGGTFHPGDLTTPADVLCNHYVSGPLEAQTISGTLDGRILQSQGSTLSYHRIYMYVGIGDTTAVRGVLLDFVGTTALPGGGSPALDTAALSSVDAEAGDRIHMEIGVRVSTEAGINYGVNIGTGTCNSSDVVQADAAADNDSTLASWIEFSGAITEQAAGSAPPNCTSGTATTIASLPFEPARLDTTVSTETDKSVWWQWTANFTGKIIVSTLDSNYDTNIMVRNSALTIIASNQNIRFGPKAQAICTADVTSGQLYYIQVYNRPRLNSSSAWAFKSGGDLKLFVGKVETPAYGDIYVVGKNIVAYRSGVPINAMALYYTNIPAGPAFDYSGRTIDTIFNGPHSGHRMMFGAFDVETIEIIDPDLSLETQLNYIYLRDPVTNKVPAGYHINTVVTEDTQQYGYTGSWGNGFNFIAGLSSADAANPRKVDLTVMSGTAPFQADIPAKYSITLDQRSSDYIDLATDQKTLFYTSSGQKIKRYDVLADAQLADFKDFGAPIGGVLRPGLRDLCILPDGGVLVTQDGIQVTRLDSAGNVVQTYTPSDPTRAQSLEKLDLGVDAIKFTVIDVATSSLFEFELESGTQMLDVRLGLPLAQISGCAVYGGFRAGTPTATPAPPTENVVSEKIESMGPVLGGPVISEQTYTNTIVRPNPIADECPCGNGAAVIYELSDRYSDDDGCFIRRVRRSPHITVEDLMLFFGRLEVIVETGLGADGTGQGTDPQIMVRWSDDGGKTWSNEVWMPMGKIGAYRWRTRLERLGRSMDRVFELVFTEPVPLRIIDAFANYGVGKG